METVNAMKVTRKFSLARIGHQYETIEIEMKGEHINDIIVLIDDAWKAYCAAIKSGVIA
jgi:hypothetical protein